MNPENSGRLGTTPRASAAAGRGGEAGSSAGGGLAVGICWTNGGNATPTALNTALAQPGACGRSTKALGTLLDGHLLDAIEVANDVVPFSVGAGHGQPLIVFHRTDAAIRGHIFLHLPGLGAAKGIARPTDDSRWHDAGMAVHPEYIHGAELEEYRETTVTRGKRTTTIYRWMSAVPLRATDDTLAVNGFSIEIQNSKGKRITTTASSPIWRLLPRKIENETFNVLKTGGYNLEHNFGHGKETLASVLVVLNLLAFAFHTAARLAVLAWREAVIARGATYRFFEHLRTVTVYVVFQNWDHLLRSIAAAAIRPP
jgi:hypothetical protein